MRALLGCSFACLLVAAMPRAGLAGDTEEQLSRETLVDAELSPESPVVALDEDLSLDLVLTNNALQEVVLDAQPTLRLMVIDSSGRATPLQSTLLPSFVEQLRSEKRIRIAPGGALEIPIEVSSEALRRAGIRSGAYSLSLVLTTPVETRLLPGQLPGAHWNGSARTSARLEFRARPKAPPPTPTPTPVQAR